VATSFYTLTTMEPIANIEDLSTAARLRGKVEELIYVQLDLEMRTVDTTVFTLLTRKRDRRSLVEGGGVIELRAGCSEEYTAFEDLAGAAETYSELLRSLILEHHHHFHLGKATDVGF